MRRICILVEGQTEEVLVTQIFAPELLRSDVWLQPVVLTTKRPAGGPNHHGGVSKREKIEREITLLLRDRSYELVTTLIDYYGLPTSTPGLADQPDASAQERVAHVGRAITAKIGDRRFLPFLALHETEAWVMAAAEQLGELLGSPQLAETLKKQVAVAGGPEMVNDSPQTAPSKRIQAAYPAYRKTADGPMAIAELGLDALRAACPHLDAWWRRLLAD